MRRLALALVVLAAVLGIAAAGCGGEESVTATPETVEGTTTETTTTETQTTDSTTTETQTTESTPTETTPGLEGDPIAGKEIFLGPSSCGAFELGFFFVSKDTRHEDIKLRTPRT